VQARPSNSEHPFDELVEDAARLYIKSHRLAQFVDTNREGFRKILKKHDKFTEVKISDDHLLTVNRLLPASDADFARGVRVPASVIFLFLFFFFSFHGRLFWA
jgi:SPX domain protein involved in polyphosphate accumulation